MQVWHDVLGLFEDFVPRHTRRFRTLGDEVVTALGEYDADVRAGRFPTAANSSKLDDEILAGIVAELDATR